MCIPCRNDRVPPHYARPMSTVPPGPPAAAPLLRARKRLDRIGDRAFGVCLLAALLAGAAIVRCRLPGDPRCRPAISEFGLGFLTDTAWQPNFGEFGAGSLIFGTAVSSFVALAARRPDRDLDRPLPEPAGAVRRARRSRAPGRDAGGDPQCHPRLLGGPRPRPLRPATRSSPALHDTLGFIPIFGAPETTGSSVFTASLILTIMVVPIIASISRDLFQVGPARHPGRRQRPRRDPLGGDPRGRPALDRLGDSSPPRCSASAARSARRSPSPR